MTIIDTDGNKHFIENNNILTIREFGRAPKKCKIVLIGGTEIIVSYSMDELKGKMQRKKKEGVVATMW